MQAILGTSDEAVQFLGQESLTSCTAPEISHGKLQMLIRCDPGQFTVSEDSASAVEPPCGRASLK